jgi:hypothetical protein
LPPLHAPDPQFARDHCLTRESTLLSAHQQDLQGDRPGLLPTRGKHAIAAVRGSAAKKSDGPAKKAEDFDFGCGDREVEETMSPRPLLASHRQPIPGAQIFFVNLPDFPPARPGLVSVPGEHHATPTSGRPVNGQN